MRFILIFLLSVTVNAQQWGSHWKNSGPARLGKDYNGFPLIGSGWPLGWRVVYEDIRPALNDQKKHAGSYLLVYWRHLAGTHNWDHEYTVRFACIHKAVRDPITTARMLNSDCVWAYYLETFPTVLGYKGQIQWFLEHTPHTF